MPQDRKPEDLARRMTELKRMATELKRDLRKKPPAPSVTKRLAKARKEAYQRS